LLFHKLVSFGRFVIVMNAHKISSGVYKSYLQKN
jgi:hypothetical protein